MKDMKTKGFTIVELLVVIVVIGVLAAITIVSYTGIANKAIVASLVSDLSQASKKLKVANAINGLFPDSTDCAQSDSSSNVCIKSSPNNTFYYKKVNSNVFALAAVNGNTCYSVTSDAAPQNNCVVIGSQVWMSKNMDVGTMITLTVSSAQTDNQILEKYCAFSTPSNCTASGGLYQWDEAMQYSTTEGAQGICPTGFHIPTDAEWKALEVYLGMSQATADTTGWRGTDQGTKLKVGGSSRFEAIPAGYTTAGSAGMGDTNYSHFWTSTQSGVNAWNHAVHTSQANVQYNSSAKTNGFPVRCIMK